MLHRPQSQVTPEREAELERLPLQIASQQEWETYKSRNDSLIVDFFQGQFRNRMECMTCHKVRYCGSHFPVDLPADVSFSDIDNIQSIHVPLTTDPSSLPWGQGSTAGLFGRPSEQGGHDRF